MSRRLKDMIIAIPKGLGFADGVAQAGHHQFVLRAEVAVHRHFVRPGRLGDRIDANAAEPVATEQLAGSADNAVPRFLPNDAAILHDDPPSKYFVPTP
jgi:hypothetical protein